MTAAGGGRVAAIDALLGVAGARWIVERVRRRLESGDVMDDGGDGFPAMSGTIRLARPTDEQREAAARIVGRPRRAGSGLTVDLADVEAVLRRGPWPAGLADAVVTLTGPVVDRRAVRDAEAAAWQRARDGLAGAAERFPGLGEWWESWCGAGGLKRVARAEVARVAGDGRPGSDDGRQEPGPPGVAIGLVAQVAAVLEELPVSGEPLAVLARRVVGDAHGLDASRPLGRVAAAVVGAAFAGGGAERDRDRELSVREAWAAAGVVMSAVASTVLCLGVPGTGSGPTSAAAATAAMLDAMRAARMPTVLTLDQVRSGGVGELGPGGVVHVCENPTVVEVVAARWASSSATSSGAGSGPVLVCTWGQPSTAVVELLRALTADGVECRYHGDFDWAGLRIARALAERLPWTPWRFTAADYLAAVQAGAPSRALTGSLAESPWDPELADAMAARGLAVDEEAVADLLAGDLVG
ncbi:hypothetical protein GCM10027059_45470 [Myceligenerans halotolerans]